MDSSLKTHREGSQETITQKEDSENGPQQHEDHYDKVMESLRQFRDNEPQNCS